MLVLLSDIVLLAQIDEIYDGFGSKEEKRVDEFDLEFHVSDACREYSRNKWNFKSCIRTGFVSHNALCVYNEAFDELGLFRPHGPLSS